MSSSCSRSIRVIEPVIMHDFKSRLLVAFHSRDRVEVDKKNQHSFFALILSDCKFLGMLDQLIRQALAPLRWRNVNRVEDVSRLNLIRNRTKISASGFEFLQIFPCFGRCLGFEWAIQNKRCEPWLVQNQREVVN
ncbi:hypothetical protein FOQG_12615 [Fusarium oxysporum f. sp. raphani 54005]|uniref:Uncharacterized protein n=2 Tax=Fusarium oxysporum TaxID=5507 RepID=X0CKL8_FUSOX|nr:hypothetical protein FOVG_05427 [Fusarium oxysporum f. sp. pisi HDV247]EXK83097.1 hypothetical protein FOQG_12615 [Fusarium oxysporum f. sp. raphani 54005]KAI8409197.1 hypothetical protein FOFC_09029 [Fusarium oxysporum]